MPMRTITSNTLPYNFDYTAATTKLKKIKSGIVHGFDIDQLWLPFYAIEATQLGTSSNSKSPMKLNRSFPQYYSVYADFEYPKEAVEDAFDGIDLSMLRPTQLSNACVHNMNIVYGVKKIFQKYDIDPSTVSSNFDVIMYHMPAHIYVNQMKINKYYIVNGVNLNCGSGRHSITDSDIKENNQSIETYSDRCRKSGNYNVDSMAAQFTTDDRYRPNSASDIISYSHEHNWTVSDIYHLSLLGLNVYDEVTEETLKSAYYESAKKSHPDVTNGNGNAIHSIITAFNILLEKLKK
jgi:hypothetical protein